MDKPQERKVSILLNLSAIITETTRTQVHAQRGAVAQTMAELGRHGAFSDLPPGFASSAMIAMQEAVMEMAAKKPRHKSKLIEQAFEAFWRMAK
jgi:hypothetical protein